jgi:hypothetical protein
LCRRLGGRHSSFAIGAGAGFAWQHDIRWQPDGTLTIFDDGATPKEHSESRAIRERIDWRRRAVALVGRDIHAPALLAGSQGNDQMLPDSGSARGGLLARVRVERGLVDLLHPCDI